MIDAGMRLRAGALLPGRWTLLAAAIAALVILPVAAVLWIAAGPAESIWQHLTSVVLPRYLATTLLLMAGVGVLVAGVGTGAAWLVVMHDFPGRRWLDHALLAPLAVPAWIGAYALVDLMDYAGPVQGALRAAFGWASARDYWFPQTRSLWMAVIVLAAGFYPYVYLLARAAFREQSGNAHDVARVLGCGPWGVFLRVGLPMARPAIAAGVALALMETVADYGTVQHFGVQTLTTGIFTTWLDGGNRAAAARIAVISLALILCLVAVERASRRRARFNRPGRNARPVERHALPRPGGWIATGLCLVPVAVGFVLPVGLMIRLTLRAPEGWLAPGLGAALWNTLFVGGVAALVTVGLALLLVQGARLSRGAALRHLLPLTVLGYATPGAVLALGLMIPLAALDHALADLVLALSGRDPGLMLTGTSFALGLAFVLRFFGVAEGAVEAAHDRIAPSLGMAARVLGQGPGGVLLRVQMPLMRGSVLTALLIVFVDCTKELPATLMLRPFGHDTLASRVFELSSLERLSEAAPAALLVIATGLAAVMVLARANRETRRGGGAAPIARHPEGC